MLQVAVARQEFIMLFAGHIVPLQSRVNHGEFVLNVGQLWQCTAGLSEQAAPGYGDAFLGEIADGDGSPALHCPGIRLDLASDETKEGGFPSAVRADQPDPVAFTQVPVEAAKQLLSAEGQRKIDQLEHGK